MNCDVENGIEIESLGEYIQKIGDLRQNESYSTIFFRGQQNNEWKIEPSIFRDNMLSIEHELMQLPLQEVPEEFTDMSSMFDIMTKYQHYGMCTRLLDLTTNPLVALYFACKLNNNQNCSEKEFYGVIYYKYEYKSK